MTKHYLSLFGIIVIGAILRFCNLDLKPLWLDEVITAIFSLGKEYTDVPLDVVFPLEQLQDIFTYQPGVSCPQIAQNIATQSTHPPLFFCWMYSWLGWMSPLGENWVTKLRSLPALFGVGAIAAIYYVNRLAFSKLAGLTAAMVMAVSPFAVHLSQEARHYTLPMLLITLSLLGLVQIQQDIFQGQKIRFWVWLVWTITNIIGLYVHYFFILALVAEIGTLLILIYWYRKHILNQRQTWLALIISISTVALSFLPWLPVVLSAYNRPETEWIDPPNVIAPLYQTLLNWVIMVIFLPLENQPLFIQLISGLLMLGVSIWIGWQVCIGLKQLWCKSTTHLATLTLLSCFIGVLLEFFAISYFLEKDITAVPRYSFVYYPSFCALIGVSISESKKEEKRRKNNTSIFLCYSLLIIFFFGVISSIFVDYNLVFLKPFSPERVALAMNQDPSIPLMVVVGYKDYQDVALGLSFALALKEVRSEVKQREKVEHEKLKIAPTPDSRLPTPHSPLEHEKLKIAPTPDSLLPTPHSPSSDFAFFKQSPSFESVWQKISELPSPQTTKLNLWVVAPGLKRRDYPKQLTLSQNTTCTIDTSQHYRVGIPYQLYRCGGVTG